MLTLPPIAVLQAKIVEIEHGYVGEGRYNDPGQIAKFLALEGMPYQDGSGNPYAFCISGLCFSWMKALAVLLGIAFTPDNIVSVLRSQVRPILVANYFSPSALCTDVISDLQRRGRWLSKADAIAQGETLVPGTPVFYEFSPGDHHAETVMRTTTTHSRPLASIRPATVTAAWWRSRRATTTACSASACSDRTRTVTTPGRERKLCRQ